LRDERVGAQPLHRKKGAMPSTQRPDNHETQRLRDDLATLRDEIRLKIHLAGMDVKQEWDRIDQQLRRLEQLFGHRGAIAEATRRKARDVEHAMREIVHKRLPQPRTADVMTASPGCCRPDEPLSAAARIMWERDCGAVPVIDDDGKPLGMITDRDICVAAFGESTAHESPRVADAMSSRVVSCRPEDLLDVAARAMMDHEVRRVIVVGDRNEVVGIVSLADLSRHCHDQDLVAQVLTAVSAPRM
jgi:CBS domain-containing protein